MTETKDQLRFGLIGCGDIGVLRAAGVVQSGHRLTAVSDVSADKMNALAQQFGAAAVGDWQSLVSRPDVDAVIVSTPPMLHADMTIAAVKAGKHVLCEKPLARDPAECQAMVRAAQEAKRVLTTGFNYRFYPSFQLAHSWLNAGRIGELSHISSYGGYSATGHNQAWVHDGAVVGGGAMHDIGIHVLDLTRWFLGEVEDVQGMATGRVWNFSGCEDNAFALLRGPKNRLAAVHASWTEWGKYEFLIEMVGAKGRIRASCFPMMAELLESEGPGKPVRRTVEKFRRVFVYEHLKSYKWVVVQSFIEEFRAFARAVRGETTDIATGVDGTRAIEIAYAVSHGNGVVAGAAR
jgi:UDP-N-acetylglucosamine 3-dehydrogenase